MTDELNDRLEAQGAAPGSAIEPGFADRLESKLRVQHAEHARPARRRLPALLPRLGVALLIVAAGIAGVAALTARDAGVPVSVIDDEPIASAGEPRLPEQEAASVLADVTSTPTAPAVENDDADADDTEPVATSSGVLDPTAVAVEPTATPAPAIETAVASPTVAPAPQPTSTSVPSAEEPTSTPDPTAAPTPTTPPTPTAQPVPTATIAPALATAVPVPTPSAAPTPTATAEPVPIDLSCESRQSGDAVGVVCEWNQVSLDSLTHYEVLRSRNGGERAVVSRQRAAMPTVFVDRDVEAGDDVIYLVRGRGTGNVLLAASVRQVVTVPTE